MYIFPHNNQADSKAIEFGISKVLFLLFTISIFSLFLIFRVQSNHASADSPKIYSGVKQYCLDDSSNKYTKNNVVDDWQCNSTDAQVWSDNGINIVHGDNYCLSVLNNSQSQNALVGLDKCSDLPGQVWLRYQGGFENPNSRLCLTSSPSLNSQLYVSTCSNPLSSDQTWKPSTMIGSNIFIPLDCNGSEGQKVACYAEHEWTTWESGSISHTALLTSYTNGAAYEEWCADFVSYVYKEAGYPFSGGESDGWDENIAGNVQYMGFTLHMANSGYIPQAGDVAYFNYKGGHVELVVSGGKHPTFIYGNSATIDPTTGNGEMEANTILSEGSQGGIVYYLSPNN